MNIRFVYTNINGFHYDNYHYGVGSLVQKCVDEGHTVSVNVILHKNKFADFEEDIKNSPPDVVGFSSVSSQFAHCQELAKIVKQHSSKIITICGGVHPTLAPEEVIDAKFIDFFLRGEGEVALSEFLRRIKNKENYYDSPNMCYEKDGELVKNDLMPLTKDLDIFPIPNKTIYPYYEASIKRTKTAPFFFTRGCPFTCKYCFNQFWAQIYDRNRNYPRFRSAEVCIKEMEDVVSRHIDDIEYCFIGDDIFGQNGKWRKEFCDKYKERIFKKYGMKFMILMRVEMIKPKLLTLLKDSGCFRIFFGVESGDEIQRKEVLDRKMSDSTIQSAFDLCREYGLETLAVNIIGFPDETEEMIKKTIKLNRKLKPTTSGVNIFYPYRGTELGDKCFKENLVDMQIFDNFDNERRESVLNFSEDHHEMLLHYYNNWTNLVQPVWSRQRFEPLLKQYFEKIGMLDAARKLRKFYRNSKKAMWYRPGRAA